MSIDLPTTTEQGGSGGRSLPASGVYEIVDVATGQNRFGDDIISLSLLDPADANAEIQGVDYKYKLTAGGSINKQTNGGRLRDALAELGIEGWDLEGLRFNFEQTEFTLEGGPAAGRSYTVLLPTAAVESTDSATAGSPNGAASDDGYTVEGMSALLELLTEPKAHGVIFKEAAKVPAIKGDTKLWNDIMTQKAFSKVPGIKKDQGKYVAEG